jgi:hypothetical protein
MKGRSILPFSTCTSLRIRGLADSGNSALSVCLGIGMKRQSSAEAERCGAFRTINCS